MIEIDLGRGYTTKVDEDLYPILRHFGWAPQVMTKRVYARCYSGFKAVFLHRVVMDAPEGLVVDHINGDCLDNRRANLRLATFSQNAANMKVRRSRTGFKGVEHSRSGRFVAYICAGGKKRNLGTFETIEEAAMEYDLAAVDVFGEFADLNFPAQRSA